MSQSHSAKDNQQQPAPGIIFIYIKTSPFVQNGNIKNNRTKGNYKLGMEAGIYFNILSLRASFLKIREDKVEEFKSSYNCVQENKIFKK